MMPMPPVEERTNEVNDAHAPVEERTNGVKDAHAPVEERTNGVKDAHASSRGEDKWGEGCPCPS